MLLFYRFDINLPTTARVSIVWVKTSGVINNIVTVVASDVTVTMYTFRALKPLFRLDLKNNLPLLWNYKKLFPKFT